MKPDRVEAMGRRARKFVSGDGSPRDLDHLFIWLRDNHRTFGHADIREIGHLISHPERRDKGVLFERVSDVITVTSYHMARMSLTSEELKDRDPTIVKAEMAAAAHSSLRLMSQAELQRLGFRRRHDARPRLSRLLQTVSLRDSQLIEYDPESPKDQKLFSACLEVIRVLTSFDEDQLASAFCNVLKKNGLVASKSTNHLKSLLSVYLLSRLHGTIVASALHDYRVSVGYDPHQEVPVLAASTQFEVTNRLGIRTVIRLPVFETSLPVADWCETELLLNNEWKFDIEVGENWKLRMV